MKLKVRFWDIDGGKMSAGIDFEEFIRRDEDLQFPDTDESLPFKDFMFFRKEYSDPMLFTGLYDKNGKEVYECDIFINSVNNKWEILWDQKRHSFITKKIGDTESYLLDEHMKMYKKAKTTFEIIGNTYKTI